MEPENEKEDKNAVKEEKRKEKKKRGGWDAKPGDKSQVSTKPVILDPAKAGLMTPPPEKELSKHQKVGICWGCSSFTHNKLF